MKLNSIIALSVYPDVDLRRYPKNPLSFLANRDGLQIEKPQMNHQLFDRLYKLVGVVLQIVFRIRKRVRRKAFQTTLIVFNFSSSSTFPLSTRTSID